MFEGIHSLSLDRGCPLEMIYLMRKRSPEEAAEIRRIRDMQKRFAEYIRSRSMSSISASDIGAFLLAQYPQTWKEELQCLLFAIDAMDLGVSPQVGPQ